MDLRHNTTQTLKSGDRASAQRTFPCGLGAPEYRCKPAGVLQNARWKRLQMPAQLAGLPMASLLPICFPLTMKRAFHSSNILYCIVIVTIDHLMAYQVPRRLPPGARGADVSRDNGGSPMSGTPICSGINAARLVCPLCIARFRWACHSTFKQRSVSIGFQKLDAD
jgi:hypothetical protein